MSQFFNSPLQIIILPEAKRGRKKKRNIKRQNGQEEEEEEEECVEVPRLALADPLQGGAEVYFAKKEEIGTDVPARKTRGEENP